MTDGLMLQDAINETCPWPGKPVVQVALMRYRGRVIGFCNPGCRDEFEQAQDLFDRLIDGEAR